MSMNEPAIDDGEAAPSVARQGARVLMEALGGDGYQFGGVRNWLLGAEFPRRQAMEAPHEAIVGAIREVHACGGDTWAVRSALGQSLAEILEDRPERKGGLETRVELLFNLYELARIIQVPEALAAPLAGAMGRDLPDDVHAAVSSQGRLPQYLLTATSANQLDDGLRETWLELLRHTPVGEALRDHWDSQWGHGWDAIRDMPAALGVGLPNLDVIGRAQADVMAWIDYEVRHDPTVLPADVEEQRLIQYHDMLDEVCVAWPTVNRDRLRAMTITYDAPEWALLVLFTSVGDDGRLRIPLRLQPEITPGQRDFLGKFRKFISGFKDIPLMVPRRKTETISELCHHTIMDVAGPFSGKARILRNHLALVHSALSSELRTAQTDIVKGGVSVWVLNGVLDIKQIQLTAPEEMVEILATAA